MANELTSREPKELSADINVITAEINAYQQVAGEAIFEIGRRLKHVKENDLAHGEWAKWCEKEIGMTTQYANRFIRVFDRFSNRNPGFSFAKVTLSTLNALVPFTDEQLEQEYELPNGTRKKPVDMSRRQIEELKRRLRQAEKQAEAERRERERLEQEHTELTNDEIELLRKENESLRKINEINERRAEEGDKLKDELERLGTSKDDYGRAINAATELSALVVKIEHLLKDELAPIKYSRAITEQRDNEVVQRNLSEIVSIVRGWCDEMDSYLNKNNYIDVEVISYE